MEEKLDAILDELQAIRRLVQCQQELMTLEETAEFLGISMNVMYSLKEQPGFPVKQLGPRVYRVPKQALIQWFNKPKLKAVN